MIITVLVVTIQEVENSRFKLTIDNLRREDATAAEIAMANTVEKVLAQTLITIADEVLSLSMNQSGPLAENIAQGKETP